MLNCGRLTPRLRAKGGQNDGYEADNSKKSKFVHDEISRAHHVLNAIEDSSLLHD
jgi:hypothetical protein